ncbi:MAG: hypothetical protein PWR24_771 [Desulfonauticus sp.]|jgi:hypothetical protein|nr:hypothetical protein [Desulfonauticus sp.]
MGEKYSKIAVVDIPLKHDCPESVDFEILYRRVGLNTGNLLFVNAVYRHIMGKLESVGYLFDPHEVNKKYDVLVIPAVNWLHSHFNWSSLNALLKKVEIPIVPLGIGLQATEEDLDKVVINNTCLELINLLSQKSKYISTRGEFTSSWLKSIGIKNVVTTGCPSLYMKFNNKFISYTKEGDILLQGTRHGYISENSIISKVNKYIYSFAGSFFCPIIYQSEPE